MQHLVVAWMKPNTMQDGDRKVGTGLRLEVAVLLLSQVAVEKLMRSVESLEEVPNASAKKGTKT